MDRTLIGRGAGHTRQQEQAKQESRGGSGVYGMFRSGGNGAA